MEWSWTTWAVSVAAVAVSGLVAWVEGLWRRRPGLDIGFVNHGGMWGDAVLLPLANAAIVPWLAPGWWLAAPLALAAASSVAVHVWWHGGVPVGVRDHMWPSRPTGHWAADLSWAGWCHVAYVTGELGLLLAFAATLVPRDVVLLVTVVLTLHVPLGLLQPAWFATGRVFPAGLRLLAATLAAVWAAGWLKWGA